jgi:hypothetical protein
MPRLTVSVAGLGSNDSFLAESFVINWAHRDIPTFKSRCPNALRDASRPNIWGRTRLDRLDVGVTAINFWLARPDLNFFSAGVCTP